MIRLLPLEQNALLTEISKEIDLWGGHCLVIHNCVVDVGASVYEILSRINAGFPDVDIPFTVIFENTVNYVQEWESHFKNLRCNEETKK